MIGFLTLAAEKKDVSPVDHVVNHVWFTTDSGWWLWSGQQTNLVLSGLILLVVGVLFARAVATGPESEGHSRYVTKNPFFHMIEVIYNYLKEQVVRPLLHERTDRLMPVLATFFFFILVNNLLGLVPLLDVNHLLVPAMKADHTAFMGGTATQNLFVTAFLAIVAGLFINIEGIRELGPKEYVKHLTAGAPVFVWPILVPIEILGIIIKPVALAIRLFANMTAGHILLATLFFFVKISLEAGLGVGVPVTAISAVGAIAIMFLEIFVAFLQAFVFMFLVAVFVSLLSHHGDHEHEHEHDHAHGHDGHSDDAHVGEAVPA